MSRGRVSIPYNLSYAFLIIILIGTALAPVMDSREIMLNDKTLPSFPPSAGNWTVTGNETYTDTDLQVNGNISVTGSLVLDNTSLLINGSDIMPNSLVIEEGGSLVLVNGSVISGVDSASFFMKARWNSYLEINGSMVENCGLNLPSQEQKGIYVETDRFYVNNSVIRDGYTGVVARGANISIKDSSLSDMFGNAVRITEGSHAVLKDMNITRIQETGIHTTNSTLYGETIFFEECYRSVYTKWSDVHVVSSGLTSEGMRTLESRSSSVTLEDCFYIGGGSDTLFSGGVSGPSIIDLINTTFTVFDIQDDSMVNEYNRLDFHVTTNGGEPAHLADLEITDPDGNVELQALTDENGRILDRPIISLVHNSTGTHVVDPHKMTVLFEGAQREKHFNVTDGHYVAIEVLIFNPDVEISSPSNGTWLDDRTVTVSGTVTDDRSIESLTWYLDDGPEIVLDPTRFFNIELTFGEDGYHRIRVRAMDDDGKYDEDVVEFGVDTEFPSLEITSPREGVYLNRTPTLFEGTCDADADLFIDGAPVPHADGEFSFEVFLYEGQNMIDVMAVDRAGNTVEVERRVYLDTTPPSIMISTPVNGTRTSKDSVTVKGAVSHDTENLTINGEEVGFTIGGFEHTIEGLVEGSNRIVFRAVDRTGTSSLRYLHIFVDTQAPLLQVIQPPRYTNSAQIEISGSTERGAYVLVNGVQANVQENGDYITTVELFNGKNNISVSATDDAGNRISRFFEVIYDNEKPTFSRISPLDRTILKNIVVTIEGEVYDDSGISMIKGYTRGETPRELSRKSTFEWVVTLEPGENIFNIEAEDLAGNLRSTELHYTYDPSSTDDNVKPLVTIIEPFANETLEEGDVVIKGTASDDRELFRVRVRVDGEEWVNAQGLLNWSHTVSLERGVHVIEVMAEDSHGNVGKDTVRVMIVSRAQDANGEEEDDGLGDTFTVIAVILIVLAIFMVIFLFVRNQKLREEWIRERETEPERRPPQRRTLRHRRP